MMDTSNRRPLLQQSSDDEASDLDAVVKSQKDDLVSASSSSRSISNASTVTARKHSKDESIHAIDNEDEEDEEETSRQIDVNAAKELLRSENAPKDRFSFNYIGFYLLGMTTLLPWNFLITAEDVSNLIPNNLAFYMGQLFIIYKDYNALELSN